MNNARLASLLVGRPRRIADSPPWYTGLFKEPAATRIMLRFANLDGDGQADERVHGGSDKAVCVYSGDHYADWRKEPQLSAMAAGAFGENFTVAGQVETLVCIGDLFRAGDAIVEISQPRGPCWKIGRRWEMPDLPRMVLQNGRTGWYLRVIEEGSVGSGDELTLLDRPHERWTIARVNEISYAQDTASIAEQAAELLSCEKLARGWRAGLARRVLRAPGD